MIENFLIFIFSLLILTKGATLATKYSAELAEGMNLSKYVVGFIVVSLVSILPETLISINSAARGIPEFGLGTLFGSNIADLTIVFTVLILYAKRGIKVESKLLKDVRLYPFFILLPIIFGLDGNYSRIEGAGLIISGMLFYYLLFKNDMGVTDNLRSRDGKYKNSLLLILAMILLLIGSYFVVASATELALALKINPIIIGMLVVSLGTVIPELFFSLKSIKKNEDDLAIGDILGSVLADATLVVGFLAFVHPFYFPVKIIYITGVFMVMASLVLLKFMRSGKVVTKKEGFLLLAFWVMYVLIEFIVNK